MMRLPAERVKFLVTDGGIECFCDVGIDGGKLVSSSTVSLLA
jgi:hypothetical protein